MRTVPQFELEVRDMRISINPTKEVKIFGLDERPLKNLLWCALSYRMDRLMWADEILFCVEVPEGAFDHEVEKGYFPISQICYCEFPEYAKYYEVEKGAQIPIVDVSHMRLYGEIIRAIKSRKKGCSSSTLI